jgi:hypothetical protein
MHCQLIPRTTALALVFAFALPGICRADEVLDWNAILLRSVRTAGTPAPIATRVMATVHAAIFDAVNGVERRYTPIHVGGKAPKGASPRAAAVEAAYTVLTAFYPGQAIDLVRDLDASLVAIAANPQISGDAIASGQAWGAQVANEILAWRATDGFDPSPSTYVGGTAPGQWRPTPPALANSLAPSLAYTVPFVIPSPSSFRPQGPPDLTSRKYAAHVEEVKRLGELTSTVRTEEQTTLARFWAGTAGSFWNRAAADTARQRRRTLSQNARLFALLNVAMADAIISCWDAKYFFQFWRPITAIQLADTDGNPRTIQQADWTPLITTPAYVEYSSGHAVLSGAAQTVLTKHFGTRVAVEGWSEGLGEQYLRHWPSFSAVADEANVARIYSGMHFRFAVRDGRAAGDAIGAYVVKRAARPAHRW